MPCLMLLDQALEPAELLHTLCLQVYVKIAWKLHETCAQTHMLLTQQCGLHLLRPLYRSYVLSLVCMCAHFQLCMHDFAIDRSYCVCSNRPIWPAMQKHWEPMQQLVLFCLTSDPQKRPFIDDVISKARGMQK